MRYGDKENMEIPRLDYPDWVDRITDILERFFDKWPKAYYVGSIKYGHYPWQRPSEYSGQVGVSVSFLMGDRPDFSVFLSTDDGARNECVYLPIGDGVSSQYYKFTDEELNSLHELRDSFSNLRAPINVVFNSRSPDITSYWYPHYGLGMLDSLRERYAYDECLDLYLCKALKSAGMLRLPFRYTANFASVPNNRPTHVSYPYKLSAGYLGLYSCRGYSASFYGHGDPFVHDIFYGIERSIGSYLNCNNIDTVTLRLSRYRSVVSYNIIGNPRVITVSLPKTESLIHSMRDASGI